MISAFGHRLENSSTGSERLVCAACGLKVSYAESKTLLYGGTLPFCQGRTLQRTLDEELASIEATRVIRVPAKTPNPDQLHVDNVEPGEQERTLQERFLEFHQANPHVYAELVKLARRWRKAGNTHGGISMFFEVLRYRRGLLTESRDDFKLNNNWRSRYARLIMVQEDDLSGFFDVRELLTK